MIENPTLPEGWTSEDSGANGATRHSIIEAPTKGGVLRVTVDWAARCYRAGIDMNGYPKLGGSYTGRGWQQRLIADAVAWLQKVVNS